MDRQQDKSSSDEDQEEKSGRLERAKVKIDRARSLQQEWVEREQDKRPSVRIVVGSIELDQRTGGSLLAGGLAYRLFLWLLPFGLFSTALLGMLSDAGDRSVSSVARDLGMGAAMSASISDATGATESGQIWFLLLGAFLMLVSARGVWKALRLASSLAWDVRPQRSGTRWKAVLGTTLILVVVAVYHYLLHPLYRGGLVGDLWATAAAVAGLCALLVWVCLRLPHRDSAGWFDMVPGALVAAVGFEGLRLFTAVYLAARLTRVNDLYGAVGVAAVFMAFLYLAARLTLGGLVLNAEFWRQRNNR